MQKSREKNTNQHYGFRKGYIQLRLQDEEKAKRELMNALSINNRVSFSNYKNGKVDLKLSQIRAIEHIFSLYGISDIWGKAESSRLIPNMI